MAADKSGDGLNDGVQHGGGHSGIDSDKKCAVQDGIRSGQVAHDAEGTGVFCPQVREGRLADEVASEKGAVADLVFVEVAGEGKAAERSRRFHHEHEGEPGRVGAVAGRVPSESLVRPTGGVDGKLEIEKLFKFRQGGTQGLPVLAAGFVEGGQFLELGAANGGLKVERFKVISEVAVDVFVVVALGEFPELPAESFVAGVVATTGTPAIASPVAKTFHQHFELHVADDIDRPAFTHGQMMGRVKGLGGEVAKGAGETPVVGGAEGIAVVFDQPKVVLLAEGGDGLKVKGIAQGMGHHDSLGLSGLEGGFELGSLDIQGAWIGVHKNRHCSVLENRGHCGGKPGGGGDDFVATADSPFAQLGAGEGGKGQEVGGGTGVGQEAAFDAQGLSEFRLEGIALRSQGEPKIEGRGHGSFNFVLVKDAAGIRDGRSGDKFRPERVAGRSLSGMGGSGIEPGEAQDFRFELFGVHAR